MQRVIMIIAETEEPLDTGDQLPATTPPRGKIEFRNVTFAYLGSEPTLKNVSFTKIGFISTIFLERPRAN